MKDEGQRQRSPLNHACEMHVWRACSQTSSRTECKFILHPSSFSSVRIGMPMDPAELRLFYHPKDRLRMTVGDDWCYPTVKPVWAAPLSRPNAYLALLNGKGEEITTISDPT